jgi:hypothetical protein
MDESWGSLQTPNFTRQEKSKIRDNTLLEMFWRRDEGVKNRTYSVTN